MNYHSHSTNSSEATVHDVEHLRLEAVTTCVGFDDLLDITLELNHPHLDTMIVVTAHDDRKTQLVCRKHGARCVQSDLFRKNGRHFNKGAAINAGMDYFQYHGWRLHLDSDIALPPNFRRVLFNHSHLERNTLYGADRLDVVAADRHGLRHRVLNHLQHTAGCIVHAPPGSAIGARYVDALRGYCPIGFFQLWHSSAQKPYPYSLGSAEHDDVMFASLWPESHRKLLPSGFVYHLCARQPRWGENWDGRRHQPRIVR
jgi:hypothetical protein